MADEPANAGDPPEEPAKPRPKRRGPLRGRGMSTTGGGITDELRRRVEAAAQAANEAAGPQARQFADRVQRMASAAREEATRRRPAAERAARSAADRVRDAAERTKPEVERLAREARVAGEAAVPHVARAAQDAAQYARDHDDELRGAAAQVARSVAPRPLRPAVDALGEELSKRPRADRDEPRSDAETGETGSTDGSGKTDDPAGSKPS